MQKKIRSVLLLFGFLFVIPVGLFASYQLGGFQISSIEVEVSGLVEPHSAEYANRLRQKLKKYEGQQFWNLDIDKIGQMVDAEKWVRDFQVTRKFPKGLRISIVPFRGVGNLAQESGVRPLSEAGDWLDEVPYSRASRLPIIRGNRETIAGKGNLAQLLAELPTEGRLGISQISEVEMDQKGDLWLKHLRTSSRIRLGTENVGLQAARVEKVLEYLEHNGLSGREIDADYSRKVLVKLYPESRASR